ncbi:hypothetical protein [Streptomyces lavendulocolor]|uniref:hypothetical protein n=1 Tax=Streptomyces lavendulocolor TaxID=67316 RepID=UPI0026D92618
MKLTTEPGHVEALAEEAVVAACPLADAADPSRWSAGAMEDVAAALEVLAGALAQLDPECAEILSVVPVAAAAVVERTEQTGAGTSSSKAIRGRAAAGTSAALRQALAAHGLTRHRVHQLGAALVTVTLNTPEALALAVLLNRRDAPPRQVQPDEAGWGAGPAETAAAALADALRAHGTGAYARVLTSGQVSAGLTPQTAQAVVTALTSPARRRVMRQAPRPRIRLQGYRRPVTGTRHSVFPAGKHGLVRQSPLRRDVSTLICYTPNFLTAPCCPEASLPLQGVKEDSVPSPRRKRPGWPMVRLPQPEGEGHSRHERGNQPPRPALRCTQQPPRADEHHPYEDGRPRGDPPRTLRSWRSRSLWPVRIRRGKCVHRGRSAACPAQPPPAPRPPHPHRRRLPPPAGVEGVRLTARQFLAGFGYTAGAAAAAELLGHVAVGSSPLMLLWQYLVQ